MAAGCRALKSVPPLVLVESFDELVGVAGGNVLPQAASWHFVGTVKQ